MRLIAKYERQRQDEWLQQRACEITAGQQELPQQIDLFNAAAPGAQARAARPWSTLTDPAEQLVAFAADTSQPPRLRSEADGVLRIDRQRASALQAQPDLDQPEVRLIGALMIVPSL